MQTRTCSKCKQEKPLEEFSFNKSRDIYCSHCKSCIAIRMKAYREKNKDCLKKYQKEYCQINKEQIKKQHKKWLDENKDKVKQHSKKSYQKNKNKCRKRHREWCISHRDQSRKLIARCHKKQREQLRDSYIKHMLVSQTSLKHTDISQELIETKRLLLTIKRLKGELL